MIIQRVVQLPKSPDSEVDDDAVYPGFSTLLLKPSFQSGHGAKITKVFFSPCAGFFFTVCNDKTIRKWTREGDEVLRFEHLSSTVTGASISPDGRMLVSCAQSKPVTLWNAESGELVRELDSNGVYRASSVEWSSDGTKIAAAGTDGAIMTWSIPRQSALLRQVRDI